MAEIRKNRAKAKLAQGGIISAVGGVVNADMADFLGQTGVDAIWIESEHGPFDYGDIPDITRSCDVWGMTSIVRVGRCEENTIYRTLDQGAQGIVVPHVDTPEQAQLAVESVKFAPIGRRGMWASRQGYGVPDYIQRANDETMLIVLIEDIKAVENLDAILKTEHIDVFFVAPSDLAQSMGHIGNIGHPEVQKTIDETLGRIVAAGRNAGFVGVYGSLDHYVRQGVRFFNPNLPSWVLAGASKYMEELKAAAGSVGMTTD